MKKATKFTAYIAAGIAISTLLITINIIPVVSQVQAPPSENQGVKIRMEMDKPSYAKGEKAQIKIFLTNTGTKPLQYHNTLIGYDVLKDGETVFGYRMLSDYVEERPFTLRPGIDQLYTFEWPLTVNSDTATVSAEPSTYTIRASLFSPVQVATESVVEVKS
jgi:hypothetical protein